MQSQLQAALLGRGSSSSGDNETKMQMLTGDDVEEVDEFVDEEIEGDGHRSGKSLGNRGVTLQLLLSAGILQPGLGVMSIEYLGQRFVGDLLEDGRIRSQETDIVFASPSAWAIACKKFINPDKKSGCGWASIRYRGRKLDAYKNIWFQKKKEDERRLRDGDYFQGDSVRRFFLEESESEMNERIVMTHVNHRPVVKHNSVTNRTYTHDANTLVECIPFSNMGKIQPFLVSLSTNAALVMDFHCHLTKSEVCGYLAGHWDVNTHSLQVTHAFPCRNVKAERDNAAHVENEIAKSIERDQLLLVGWYHSHPFCAAAPTLRDIDAQLDYEIKMKGNNDNNYSPCIGVIISPYNYENASLESSIIAYWVIPPPENKPNEYGRPMLMSYSVTQDTHLTKHTSDEMRKCVDYYKKELDFVDFTDKYTPTSTFLEKLKTTLASKVPRDESDTVLWTQIRDMIGCPIIGEKESPIISIPSVSKPTLPPYNPNLMLNSDLASVLFNSGKFPNSLLGIPDPLSQATLNANNMFLPPSLFKIQDLLKPLSTSSPIAKSKPTPLKIPNSSEMKTSIFDVSTDLSGKRDFATPTSQSAASSATSSATDYLMADLSIPSAIRKDGGSSMFESPAELNIPMSRGSRDCGNSFNASGYGESRTTSRTDEGCGTLDLSVPSTRTNATGEATMSGDFSVSKADDSRTDYSSNVSSDNN